jgi:hypothetical protein
MWGSKKSAASVDGKIDVIADQNQVQTCNIIGPNNALKRNSKQTVVSGQGNNAAVVQGPMQRPKEIIVQADYALSAEDNQVQTCHSIGPDDFLKRSSKQSVGSVQGSNVDADQGSVQQPKEIVVQTDYALTEEEFGQRKSPRLKEKNNGGKTIVKLAQDLIAKKCGIIKEDETLDNRTLQQYMDMYKKPLTEQTMDAIIKLTKVTYEKKKKKQKKEKKEKQTEGIKKTKKKDNKDKKSKKQKLTLRVS